MSSRLPVRLVFMSITLVLLGSFIGFHRNLDPVKGGKPVLYSDGVGLYDYLPGIFLRHDLQYGKKDCAFAAPDKKGRYINRYFCGTALLEMPFFGAGVLFAKVLNYPVDGYSPPFQYAVGIGAVLYVVAGLYFLFLLLVRFLRCSQNLALWIVAFTALGTNLLFYTVWFASFSHAFSFFAVSIFLYCCYVIVHRPRKWNFFLLGFLFALVFLIRPVNALIILMFPAFFGNRKTLYGFLKNNLGTAQWLLILAGGLLPFFFQCWIWYLQTGNWVAWSYRQEGFDFLHPHIGQVLFGFRRGLFVYAPLLLLCIPGIFAGWKNSPRLITRTCIFLLVFVYVTASWWHWTYGDTFGLRPFNDVLPVFMILFAFSLMRWKKILLIPAIVFTVFNLVFAWQFATGISNFSTMTADKFFHLFLQTGPAYRNLYGGVNDLPPYAPKGFHVLHTFDQPEGVLHFKGEEFMENTEFVFPAVEKGNRHLWIEVTYQRKLLQPGGMHAVNLVMNALDARGNSLTYHAVRVKEYPAEPIDQWETVRLRWWIPDAVDAGNLLKIYLWNPAHEEFYLDHYRVQISVPNR